MLKSFRRRPWQAGDPLQFHNQGHQRDDQHRPVKIPISGGPGRRYTGSIFRASIMQSSSIILRSEDLLGNLIHDLRQPLGTIETSAYLLNLVTPPDQTGAHAQLLAIERQLNHAARLLSEASAALAGLRSQRMETEESFDLTKPATAAVT